jgi:signal peptidase I
MGYRMLLANRIVRILLESAFALTVLSLQPYRPLVFTGNSMAPTYANRELVLASTDVGQVSRGDIVVITKDKKSIVKRVAYVEGDAIHYYYISGEWQCGLETTFDLKVLNEKFPHRQVRIPPGFVFVLGDNYVESQDSRVFGLVDVADISAKVPNARPRVPLPYEKLGPLTQA